MRSNVWKINRIAIILLILALALVLIPTPAYAIINPTPITFGTGTTQMYNVFLNVVETGDWLITAEQYVHYALPPTDYTASEAFLFELLSTDGTTTLASTPLNQYENKPISIYLTATQVTALVLVSGSAYGVRITGNPTVFASPTGNTVTAYLDAGDYIEQAGATDANNPLRDNLILMATNIQTHDGVTTYITTVQGIRYLTALGGSIFLEGIPSLDTMCPILFQYSIETLPGDEPESTGTYAGTLTPLKKWGSVTANGLTSLGLYLGVNQALAGSLMLFVLVSLLAFYVYRRTQSGIAALILCAAMPFIGAYMGLMPMALAFVFTIAVIVLLGYFFFARGAL